MLAQIDYDLCIGCGLCPDICPDVFEITSNIAVIKVNPIPPEAEDDCRRAMKSCPIFAIVLG